MQPAPTRFRRATNPSRWAAQAVVLLLWWGLGNSQATELLTPAIEVHDDRFHDFVPPAARVEVLADDLQWTEGPLWVPALDSLLFSDVAADRIYRWNDRDGLTIYLEPSGHGDGQPAAPWRGANGLALDAAGRLYLAQQGNRTLARLATPIDQPASRFEILADRYRGKKINSPNDLVVHESGNVYFTDPPYGLAGFENSPDIELGYFAVFRLEPDGQLEPVLTDLAKPNGIALSPAEDRLYVSDSSQGRPRIHALDLGPDGEVVGRQLFFDAGAHPAEAPGTTDGMTMHPSGHLFTSVPNGIAVLSPDGGLLGRVVLGSVTNLAFDADYRHLYLTSPGRLLRMKLR